MQKYNSRSEVPEEFKWDLTPFFKNEEEFNNTYEECSKLIKELTNYVGCTKDSNRVYEFLNKQVEAMALWEDLYVYSYLINDQELGVPESVVRKASTENLNNDLVLNTSLFPNHKVENIFYNESSQSIITPLATIVAYQRLIVVPSAASSSSIVSLIYKAACLSSIILLP